MYKRILIALEGKETDRSVLSHGLALARSLDAELTLLRVVCVADDGGGGFGKQIQLEPGSSGWRRKRLATEALLDAEAECRRQGMVVESALVVGGECEADEIARYAQESEQDLILLAGDRQPWYRRWLGGWTARGIVGRTATPTLLVSAGPKRRPAERVAPEVHPVMAVLGSANL